MVAAKHHVKDEDGVPCYIYKMPKQMLVKVGSGSSADTFQLKGAEWADVKAGSHDAAVRAQARSRPKYEAIAAGRASTPRAHTVKVITVHCCSVGRLQPTLNH